jgi:hypothetical protein
MEAQARRRRRRCVMASGRKAERLGRARSSRPGGPRIIKPHLNPRGPALGTRHCRSERNSITASALNPGLSRERGATGGLGRGFGGRAGGARFHALSCVPYRRFISLRFAAHPARPSACVQTVALCPRVQDRRFFSAWGRTRARSREDTPWGQVAGGAKARRASTPPTPSPSCCSHAALTSGWRSPGPP